MGADRFSSSLAVLQINKQKGIDIDNVVLEFPRLKGRSFPLLINTKKTLLTVLAPLKLLVVLPKG